MCGIVGCVGLEAPLATTRTLVSDMASRLRHRGPDGGGVISHPAATLGMTRLAIVDIARGHQPMANEDESTIIVYNGEVYNAPAVRRDLERRGVLFRTHSDTEVILRLYDEDPDTVEDHLVGMWAFAIHDRRRRRVILSRDRFGIKPLFVADAGSALAFASELRCFDRTLEPFRRLFSIDHSAAHAMVSWSYIPERSTIYRGVRRLEPSTRMTIDLESGRRETHKYWRLQPSRDAGKVQSLDEACEHVDAMLRRATKEHLESDVPVATLLSGGIDSSLITAYAHEESTAPIEAYAIGFAENHLDESGFAREVAQKIGVPITIEVFDQEKARDILVDSLVAHDEPFGDASSLATYLLSRAVSRDFKVALGGDGGDEVFAGYRKYLVARLRRPFAVTPGLRDMCGRALGRFSVRASRTRGWRELLRKLARTGTVLNGSDADVYTHLTQIVPLACSELLMQNPGSAAHFEEGSRTRFNHASGTQLQRSLASDLGGMLGNDMLTKIDRASMACSLETRVPFLDHRVVEFGVGLPAAYTLGEQTRAFRGKRVLRELYARRFGAALAQRKKQGFSVPIEKWLLGPFSAACEYVFDKRRLDHYGILSSAELSSGGYRRWITDVDPFVVWFAFALASWCEVTLGDGPDALRELLSVSKPGGAATYYSDIHVRRAEAIGTTGAPP